MNVAHHTLVQAAEDALAAAQAGLQVAEEKLAAWQAAQEAARLAAEEEGLLPDEVSAHDALHNVSFIFHTDTYALIVRQYICTLFSNWEFSLYDGPTQC